jgi:hypothetical protein
MQARKTLAVTMILGTMLASGCRVESDKNGDGNNVRIATPFGGMQVKTKDSDVEAGLGLPVYPGAVLTKKNNEDGKNTGAADINMSFGSFRLRVKAAGYKSTDSPDQVMAFYRKALGRYGDVIECQNDKPVGKLTQTAEGLTCTEKNSVRGDNELAGKTELKAGSQQHQHIVGVDLDGSGTKFGIVALDLPGHLSFGDKSDDTDKQ